MTKLDAFWSRGKGDFVVSHDRGDIIALLDGRQEIIEEVLRITVLKDRIRRIADTKST